MTVLFLSLLLAAIAGFVSYNQKPIKDQPIVYGETRLTFEIAKIGSDWAALCYKRLSTPNRCDGRKISNDLR